MRFRPLFVRLARKMLTLNQLSFLPRTQISPYIEWDPREFNSLADDAANKTLDQGSDWKYVHSDVLFRARSNVTNIRMCFDGARRGTGEAAAGVAAIAYFPSGERELIFRAGRVLGILNSAFLAEALAAEFCFELFFLHVVSGG